MKTIFIVLFILCAGSGFTQEINTSNPIKVKNSSTRETNITLDTSGAITAVHYKSDTVFVVANDTVNWQKSNIFQKTLSANTVFAFSNLSKSIINVIVNNPGVYTVTWPGVIKWPLGIVPIQTLNKIDIYTFIYDGTYIYGSAIQAY